MPPLLVPRRDDAPAERLARSAAERQGALIRTEEVLGWIDERRRANRFRVERIPFDAMRGWSFDPSTGNLGHDSGRFYTVEGYDVTIGRGVERAWRQPILNQPEHAILGLLTKAFDGVLHVLMQAKMEPGNCNLVQLSPTVQATWSNYTKVHKGGDVRYLEYFLGPRRGRVLADSLQSEQGTWFDRKTNRNIVVEVDGDVPEHPDFCWLTLGQIGTLLRQDNAINMDARSALSIVPFTAGSDAALHADTDVLSWFTGMRTFYDLRAERIPLAEVPHWKRGPDSIDHEDGRHFSIVAVEVEADTREITAWTQPLLRPCSEGVACFLTRTFDGVPHYLARARVEAGFVDTVELGPTVLCQPEDYAHLPAADRPPYLDLVLSADPARIRFDARQSEEGGRFLDAVLRYQVIEIDDLPYDPPDDYCWVTRDQLRAFVQHGHYLNVQARTLLTALNSMEET
jgi:oxidase EvaA